MAGGKITKIALGKSATEIEGNFEGYYQKLSMSAGNNNAFKAKDTNHGNPKKEPKAGKYFVRGWWTNHKDEPIKRAIYGQLLRFHIEMDKEYAKPGDVVYFGLYDSDMHSFGNDIVKADDPIALEHKDGSKRAYTWEKVNSENKVIIEFFTTSNLEQWTKILDEDKIFELYFRCSYVNRGNTEHRELPYNFHDYLDLGAIVIDRYKMPGLKPDGSDIADDMTYGTGYPPKMPIYSSGMLSQYKEDYTTFGFDSNRHGIYANIEPEYMKMEEVVITAKRSTNNKPIIEAPTSLPTDNTRVTTSPSPEQLEEAQRRLNEKNEKAIYNKEKCYSTFYKPEFRIPWVNFKIKLPPISTGLDTKIFDNLSDEQLFWDFENTAELYFARGELQGNLDRMIAKFKQNKGGVYEDEVLTRNIKNHPETIAYCQKVEDYIAEQLKNNFNKLEDVEDKDPYFEKEKDIFSNSEGKRSDKKKGFTKPAYSYSNPIEATKGLTIATNDIWSAEVILKEIKFSGDNYTGKYEVTLWDHFGLDLPDMEKIFNIIPSVGEVFVCWFILQHLRGYKPFITKINFTKEFSGNLQKGKAEIQAQREEQRRLEAEELNEKIQREIWSSPKI